MYEFIINCKNNTRLFSEARVTSKSGTVTMDAKQQLHVYRRWDDGFVIRRMMRGEERQVIRWFGTLEPMPCDLELAIDLRGDYLDVDSFFAGELNGEMVASLIRTPVADDLTYIGAIYVDERHRKLGFAQRMIITAQEVEERSHRTATSVIDSYDHLVSMYEKFGYKSADKITTYQGTASPIAALDRFGINVRKVADADFDRLMSYDDKCFIRPGSKWRRELLARWMKIPGGHAVVAVNCQGDVVGYGCRRPSVTVAEHHFIGPLYADSYSISWDLIQQLTSDVIGQTIIMTVVQTNNEALRLVDEMKLQPTVRLIRMFNGQPVSLSRQVVAVTNDTVCAF